MALRAPTETLDHRAPFMFPDRIGRLEVSERSDRASSRLGLVRPTRTDGANPQPNKQGSASRRSPLAFGRLVQADVHIGLGAVSEVRVNAVLACGQALRAPVVVV